MEISESSITSIPGNSDETNGDVWNKKILFNKFTVAQVLFILIVFTAAFLRLYHLDYMEFKGDESKNSFKALQFAQEGIIPLTTAVGSTGINDPPIFAYLITLPYLFSSNPVFAAGFIALINILGIVLCYHFVKKFYSLRAALIAISLYAVNPWHMLFSRKIWMQNALPPFIIVFLFLLFQTLYNKKKNYIIYTLFTLGLLFQLHLSAAYFLLLTIIILVVSRKEISGKKLGIGVLAFLLTFVPYFIFQVKNNFIDVYTMLDIMKQESRLHTEAFTIPFRLVTTSGFDYSLGADFYAFENLICKIPALDILLSVLLLASFLLLFLKRDKKNSVFIVWLVLGLLYIATNKIETIHVHYFHSFYPLFFILTGILINWLYEKMPGARKYVITGILAILVVYQLAFDLNFLTFIKNNRCINGDYGTPYAYRESNLEKVILPMDAHSIQLNIAGIQEQACTCVKCDTITTKFILKHLRQDYPVWYTP